jgi:tetratricopeptide (TPR) repeat protein
MNQPHTPTSDLPILRPWMAAGLLAAGALLVGACAPGDRVAHTELGTVDFPTSCSAEAQPELERGLALLHHMMYPQAEEAFEEAARIQDDCAMAHWGLAMANFQPFWGSADIEAGRPHAERAVALEPDTERERLYARAALAFFQGEGISYGERIRNWEAAMEALNATHPDDPEAATLYALAHLSVAPADPEHQQRANRLVAEIHGAMPEHPGAIHYGIHVHDVEARAGEGVSFARAYEDLAPSIPHALHMPSHIYVRLGEWDEVIDWNRRSADAALEHPAGEYISLHYPHALDYLMYGYLQRGEDEKAREILEELRSRDGYEPHLASAYALAAIPARWYVERRDWEGAANLEPGVPESFDWNRFPAGEAMTWFARGLGAARSGDLEGAAEAIDRLETLETALRNRDDYYWAEQTRIQRLSVTAWQSLAEGQTDEAVEEMREAAEMAAGMEKHPITPGDLQPAHELLGDLLTEAGRYAEAVEAYERTLATWPQRYHSILGAARAAAEAGQDDVARSYYEKLAELAGDTDRDEVEEARGWIQAN